MGINYGGLQPTWYCQFLNNRILEGNGVVVRRGRKEAGSKALARRTGSASEASWLDEAARHAEVRSLYGKPVSRSRN